LADIAASSCFAAKWVVCCREMSACPGTIHHAETLSREARSESWTFKDRVCFKPRNVSNLIGVCPWTVFVDGRHISMAPTSHLVAVAINAVAITIIQRSATLGTFSLRRIRVQAIKKVFN